MLSFVVISKANAQNTELQLPDCLITAPDSESVPQHGGEGSIPTTDLLEPDKLDQSETPIKLQQCPHYQLIDNEQHLNSQEEQ